MTFRQLCLFFLALILSSEVGRQSSSAEQHIPTINHGTDVLFVLDGSERVTAQQWTAMKDWLEQLVEFWNIGPTGFQVGFYTYGGGAQQQGALRQATSYQQAIQEISGLQQSGGSATASQAIRQAYQQGFSAQNGGRNGAARIIIHVNSGPAADRSTFYQQVAAAKEHGVSVFNVGVGPGASAVPGDQSLVASEPGHRYIMPAQNYMTLYTLTSPLASRVADELPADQSSTLQPPVHHEGCLQKADVVFLLDESSSVGNANFHRLLNYVKTFSGRLPVSTDGVHVGLVKFSSRPSVQFGLDLYTNRESLLKAIDSTQYTGGGTNTADALNTLRTRLFTQGMGARPGVARVAVVITDGRSSSATDTTKEADLLRQEAVRVVAVGVGDRVNAPELRAIADSQQDVFQVSTFNDLYTISERLLLRACQAQATVSPLSYTVNPQVDDPCQDKQDNCHQYGAEMCTDYIAFARDNCNRTCGFCTPILPEVLPPCADVLDDCVNYNSSSCTDPTYRRWAIDNCALFCGLCSKETSSTGYYGQCLYKGNTYKAGQSWDDGCDYECTCVDGGTGQYVCSNKCPIYSQLSAECTLVETKGECCLKPVCNFSPTVATSITSGRGVDASGVAVCEYEGHQYVQNESWDVDCTLKCFCQNAQEGTIKCQDYCPQYGDIPNNCHMEQKPGQCCSEPVCEFTTQTGSMTGYGQTSGQGTVSRPTDPPPCVDTNDHCDRYAADLCTNYIPWARENCRAYCGLCSDGRVVPSDGDRCIHNGTLYRQGETWTVGCQQQCVCEQAVYGYYRCYSLCPTYSNVPAQCHRDPPTGSSCCQTITCPAGTNLAPSATNLFSIGAGHYIQQPDPQSPGTLLSVVPQVQPGAQLPGPHTTYHGYLPPLLQGCLYKGQLYVQGQRWDDGCLQVCECTSASQGFYTCSSRCPTYQNLPLGCHLESDPADACCSVARCQAGVHYLPQPAFSVGTVSAGLVRPPNPLQLMATSSTVVVRPTSGHGGNQPPTLPTGPLPTGGIGFCIYKNKTYLQSERWTDGCDLNCLCEDASTGFWRCADMCLQYGPMPAFCKMVPDPSFPCCQMPACDIPGIKNSTWGQGSTQHPVITTRPPLVVTATAASRPASCTYKGKEYSQGQQWFDGCDESCTCYDAVSNLYTCSQRCPIYQGIDDTRCTMHPDPRDPQCCSIPVCTPPSYPSGGSTPIPTVPGGSFENTNSLTIVGFCDYKGRQYSQGDRWEDGCHYLCECVDADHGRYRCDERCPRFPDLPTACHLVPDFANPCCQKPVCDFTGYAGSISGHGNLQTPSPDITPGPDGQTPVCVYHGVQYHQGQRWDDGCSLRCRCEDASNQLYVCDDRCAQFPSLPDQCHLVTDPTDQCCRVPQCIFHPTSGQQSGQPIPYPTFHPGQVTGQVNLPTPSAGITPPPIGYCVYKGQRYTEGQRWDDGCQYSCQCQDANVGRYVCDEKCAKFPSLPAQCHLVKDPANPCCLLPDCTFVPGAGQISGTGSPLNPVTQPVTLPAQSTVSPSHPLHNPQPTPTPPSVCVYRGQVYAEGQTWYDGCDFVCVCEKGSHGIYRCNDRCPSYPVTADTKCIMSPDPADPMCCRIPHCQFPDPTPVGPGGVYVVPTLAPQGVVTGGSVTRAPRPGYVTPSPAPDGSTVYPQPTAVCVYKGQQYAQGQKWQDGCDYDCECVDAPNGQYRCSEMCPRYPPIPDGCYMVNNAYKPCCQLPVCPFNPTLPPVSLPAVSTQVPPTGPDGNTLEPPVISTSAPTPRCVYNGVPYRTGDTWQDGCDLRCRCEDENTNVYRCDQRCARYPPSPGCTLVTDPHDSCCLAPYCAPQLPPTRAPGQDPDHQVTPGPSRMPIPTALPGIVVGNSVGKPTGSNPNNETMCMYNGRLYRQGQTWIDGCDKTCVCEDQTTGRYQCRQRCPPYLNIPDYCSLMADPNDQCCQIPVCTNPATIQPTQPPTPDSAGHPDGSSGSPDGDSTPLPQPRDVCTYKSAVYVQGQQWYDGCDKVCVCEDGSTGYYRCSDRCKAFGVVPDGCTMVVDPRDPTCCRVPQCVPVPGLSGYPTPPAGQSPIPFTVTNIPGIVTGRAPTPTPATGGITPQYTGGCMYKGHVYGRGQRWQDGCHFNCVCENEVTGEYKCTERCSSFPLVPPECTLSRDPSDFCCQVMTCDPNQPTPNPYLTPHPRPSVTQTVHLGPQTIPPTPDPKLPVTPRPIPTSAPSLDATSDPDHPGHPSPIPSLSPSSFCVYKGVAYSQGVTWQEGCSKTCRCEDSDNNLYTCFDRCPKHVIGAGCTLSLDPTDPCCTVPVCPATATPTLGPDGVMPNPTPTPFPVPQMIPAGTITGSNPGDPCTSSTGQKSRCLYKGKCYTQGESWQDGCDLDCTCIDDSTGRYLCQQKCDQYPRLPSNCLLVKDPNNPCCALPSCNAPDVATPTPPGHLTPPPGQSLPPGVSALPPDHHEVTPPHRPNTSNPLHPPHSSGCVMNGRTYTEGQQWYDGCSRVCVCHDGNTGFYTCRQRCPDYPDSDPTCLVVPDPSDPTCCTMPQCPDPQNPDVPTGHKGTITGTGKPLTPLPGTTLAPQTGHGTPSLGSTSAPQPRDVCVYKGQDYTTGQRWRDGCLFDCVCDDGSTGQYTCTDRCMAYPPLTVPGCRMERDPNNPCCQVPTCSPTPAPTLNPDQTPPLSQPTSAVCVYQGVPYTQGQTWKVGCDKVCRCEDGKTGRINCDDRCPTYPNVKAGCRMVTDPHDSCCQIPSCQDPHADNSTRVVTGIPGIIEGHSLPAIMPNPLQPSAHVCVYRGVQYQQGQQWDDGCSYTCVCEDGVTGQYRCTERCARVPDIPATCSQVPDPQDLCCQVVTCPVVSHQPTDAPHPYTGPSTPAPHFVSTVDPNLQFGTTAEPRPRAGFCLYKTQYYREGQVWYDGCNAVCTCEDANTGYYRCQARCGDYQSVSSSCILVADPKDPTCCQMPECPLFPPGGATPSGPTIIRPTVPTASFTNFPTPTPRNPVTDSPTLGPDGHTLQPPVLSTQVPIPVMGCVYKGETYQENESWDDGCDLTCVCLSETTGNYRCSAKCARMPSVPNGCILIQDPENTCCQVPYCDFSLHPFTQGIPTPRTTQRPVWQPTTSRFFVPGFVTIPGGGQTTDLHGSQSSVTGYRNACVYNGAIYQQGEEWTEGCDSTCVCGTNGLYTCRDRCQSYPELDPACQLRTNPADPCCLIPDCNPNYVIPGGGGGFTGSHPHIVNPHQDPGYTGTAPTILVPTGAPGVFFGKRPSIVGSDVGITGHRDKCVYQGSVYGQGERWEDGCRYRCQCTDAIRGVYRCVERCSNLYFLPASCTTYSDPNDSCCKLARCPPDAFPTPTPARTAHTNPQDTSHGEVTVTASPGIVFQGTRSPIGITVQSFTGKPADKCVYPDGRTFRHGESWTDGCAYTCSCDDAAQNAYTCHFRCPAYSELPSFCHLASDPQDGCCQKVVCSSRHGQPLQPSISGGTPSLPATVPSGVTNIVPIGTHSIISGSGLPQGETNPGFLGGRQVCVYKGTIYMPGETWDDGCHFTCQCLPREPAIYSCASKCPTYPALPQYCALISVPGQCCPSMRCDIPDAGQYVPRPQLYPGLIPTQSPTSGPANNPQLLLPGADGTLVGGTNPPGSGYLLPTGYNIAGISNRCVYQGTDHQFRVYSQGETWEVGPCSYNCQCKDATSGFYECRPMCASYSEGSLPSSCSMETVQGQCCPALRCTNPDGSITDHSSNPALSLLPVFGVIGTGYSGFRPGFLHSQSSSIGGQSNVCVYHGTPYAQGAHWDDGCTYSCECSDGSTGSYVCKPKCNTYTALPPMCHLVTVPGDCCHQVQCTSTAPPTPPTPTNGGVADHSNADCVGDDKLSDCNLYDKASACVGEYESWARENCAVTCGYCAPAHPTTPGPCVDADPDCSLYDTSSACGGSYLAWAREHCAKTCNLCPCYDKDANCDQYGSYACGGQYHAWALEHCAKTCGLCPGGVSGHVTSAGGSGQVPDGWTLLLKGVSGAPGDLWSLWSSPNTANTNVPTAQLLTAQFPGHYKGPGALQLESCDFDKMKVAVYNNGVEKASVVFDGRYTGRDDWFDSRRILDSSFSDIGTQQHLLQIASNPATGHEFYIGQPVSGCSGSAWIMVSTTNTCSYQSGANPTFYYSSSGTTSSFDSGNLQSGDVFAIMGQGGTCAYGLPTLSSFTNHTAVCIYNNQIYSQDEWWQDGCRYNCTCEDAMNGRYRCYDLCPTYLNLPPGCALTTQPGQCCAKPVGVGCGSSGGCLYKGSVYHEGQTWVDSCQYSCTCRNGASGLYQCTSYCLDFNLPSVCHFEDPAPGKCCRVPVCPEGFQITYPPGYEPK